ncbi:hypothetical protein COU91_03420 [Candidatus Saccharibacteria bacterium CG10_big_fil_rev_8_21_14_0_10_47_8]|nr:MAG: hypothetical protein COU91_03420 [Candidatus Saccharibacteria bacterium CG10_big_fil_rev_8_21_14_0_10_47_8]
MSRLFKLAAVLSVVPAVAFASPVRATVQSSVEGGDIYRVKNITKNVDFIDPAKADACDVLQYKVRIHNPGPTEVLTNVTVQAGFQTAASTKNVSIITMRASNASPSNTSDTATVNLSSAQGLNYVSGSTELLDANGNLIKTLPDGITQAGVSIGNVGVSVNEKRFVQFKEKVNCPTPPVTPPVTPPTPPVTLPAKPVIPVVQGKTTELPNTGPGDVAAVFAGASAFGAAGHYISRRFRRN